MRQKETGVQVLSNECKHWKECFERQVQEAIDEGSLIKDHKLFIKHILEQLESEELISRLLNVKDRNKCSKMSAELRATGNTYYCSIDQKPNSGNLDRAFEEYTKSIAYAPPKTQELSLAYANRSAVFCKARLFSDCLLDIERAFENDCPDNQKAKLYLRKATCLQILEPDNEIEIDEIFAKSRKWMKKVDAKERKFLSKKLEVQEYTNPIDKIEFPKWNYQKFIPRLKSKNRKIPGFSDSVKLEFTEEFGRHFVAAQKIKPGETLAIQTPYVKSHLKSMRWKFCCECGEQMWSSVPCDDCAIAMYCSEVCREKGKFEYHEIECNVIQSLEKFGLSERFFIITRLIAKALSEMGGSIEILMRNLEKIDAQIDPLKKGMTQDLLDPTKFSSVYELSVHPVKNHLKTSFFANSILIAYLFATKSNFFGDKMSGNLDEMKEDSRFIFLIEFVQKIMQLNNTNNLTTTIIDEGNKPQGLFHGIFPAVSFFNHSCNPNIVSSVQGDKLIITAVHPIKKGEQIFFNYGQHYKVMTKQKRQEELTNKFHFI